jgi:predicted thioredoxin/glutaredoxin
VLLAHRLALESDRVRAAAVEASEFPLSAGRHSVYAVPAVVVDGRRGWAGNVPEAVFVQRLLEAANVD